MKHFNKKLDGGVRERRVRGIAFSMGRDDLCPDQDHPGKISAIKSQELIVATPNGEVKGAFKDQTVVRAEQRINFRNRPWHVSRHYRNEKQADGNFS